MTNILAAAASRPKVVIIGGGATGTGIARQAAERGFDVTLVDRGKLGMGTSGHFHGMLHSGARYAVNDESVAAECYEENQRLRKLTPSAIIDTGGMFVALDDSEAAHADIIMAACSRAGVPTEEISVSKALSLEPGVNLAIKRAFLVPDAFIDGAKLIDINRRSAESVGAAEFIEDHAVTGFELQGGKITAVEIRSLQTGESHHLDCDYVISAAGVWSGRIAAMAQVSLDMIFDKGTMIAFKDSFSERVLNRSRPESDGDLLVPDSHGRSVLGTTARVIADPDHSQPSQEEVDVLMREGVAMVPALASAEAVRVFTGVRPLFSDGSLQVEGATRSVSRSYHIIDHKDQAVSNFMSVVGGKVTLYRRMAEDAVSLLERKAAS